MSTGLFIGNNKVNKTYLGNTKVSKIFLGLVQVYPESSGSDDTPLEDSVGTNISIINSNNTISVNNAYSSFTVKYLDSTENPIANYTNICKQ